MTKTARIPNVTGYASAEPARLLYSHPDVWLASVTGRSADGKTHGTFELPIQTVGD